MALGSNFLDVSLFIYKFSIVNRQAILNGSSGWCELTKKTLGLTGIESIELP